MNKLGKSALGVSLAAIWSFGAPLFRLYELDAPRANPSALAEVGAANMRGSIASENGTLAMFLAQNAPLAQNADENASAQTTRDSQNLVLEIYADETAAAAHVAGANFAIYAKFAAENGVETKAFEVAPKFAREVSNLNDLLGSQNVVLYRQIELKRDDFAEFAPALVARIKREFDGDNSNLNAASPLAIYAFTLAKEPLKWKIFEIYANEASLAAHEKSQPWGAFVLKISQMVEKSTSDVLSLAAGASKNGLNFNIFAR